MSEKDGVSRGEVGELVDDLLGDYVSDQIEAARRAAEGCGCSSCWNTYKKWLEWAGVRKIEENKPSASLAPTDGDDDGPPDINSGNLADWYSKDF